MGAQDLANLDKIATSTDLTKVHQDGAHIATIVHHGGDIDEAIALDPDQRKLSLKVMMLLLKSLEVA